VLFRSRSPPRLDKSFRSGSASTSPPWPPDPPPRNSSTAASSSSPSNPSRAWSTSRITSRRSWSRRSAISFTFASTSSGATPFRSSVLTRPLPCSLIAFSALAVTTASDSRLFSASASSNFFRSVPPSALSKSSSLPWSSVKVIGISSPTPGSSYAPRPRGGPRRIFKKPPQKVSRPPNGGPATPGQRCFVLPFWVRPPAYFTRPFCLATEPPSLLNNTITFQLLSEPAASLTKRPLLVEQTGNPADRRSLLKNESVLQLLHVQSPLTEPGSHRLEPGLTESHLRIAPQRTGPIHTSIDQLLDPFTGRKLEPRLGGSRTNHGIVKVGQQFIQRQGACLSHRLLEQSAHHFPSKVRVDRQHLRHRLTRHQTQRLHAPQSLHRPLQATFGGTSDPQLIVQFGLGHRL